jgi:hypothetical protein
MNVGVVAPLTALTRLRERQNGESAYGFCWSLVLLS